MSINKIMLLKGVLLGSLLHCGSVLARVSGILNFHLIQNLVPPSYQISQPRL